MDNHELDNSIAGFSKDKKEEASIIPAEIANIPSRKVLLIFLKNKTNAAPKVVIKKVNIPAHKDWVIGVKERK